MTHDEATAPAALGGARPNIPWRLVSIKETAELLGLSRGQVYKLIKSGDLSVRYISERSPRIDIHDLHEWFHRQEIAAPTSIDDDTAAATAA